MGGLKLIPKKMQQYKCLSKSILNCNLQLNFSIHFTCAVLGRIFDFYFNEICVKKNFQECHINKPPQKKFTSIIEAAKNKIMRGLYLPIDMRFKKNGFEANFFTNQTQIFSGNVIPRNHHKKIVL